MHATANAMASARRLMRQRSRPDYLLWLRFRERRGTMRIRRQHAIRPYVADFYCPAARLVIEIDGMDRENSQSRDKVRDDVLASLGLRTIRVPAKVVLPDPDAAADAVLRLCREGLGPSTTQPGG